MPERSWLPLLGNSIGAPSRALTEFVTGTTHADGSGNWAVRKQQIYAVYSQFRQQRVQSRFAADHSYRLIHMQRGYQEPVCDGLRHDINNPNPEHMWAPAGQLMDHLFQLAAEREDLVGIT